jgi:hypothetical protein
MVIFHSYVSLPEVKNPCENGDDHPSIWIYNPSFGHEA